MKIQIRLTLLFTVLSTAILLTLAAFIYISASSDRENEFYNLLQKEGLTKANLLLDAGVDATILQTIYLKNREILHEVEVAIYDTAFNLLYHDAVEIDFVKETPEMIREIVNKGEIRFTQEGWQVLGLLFDFQGTPYVLTAAAYDDFGLTKLARLLRTLVMALAGGAVLIFLAIRYFMHRALNPVERMVDDMEEITASHLHLRLNEGNGKDELAELAFTFNRMLDRLENSFSAQRDFVSAISHELRTPLSALIAEADLVLSKESGQADYHDALRKILADARRLSKLATGLLDLAKASYDPARISFKPTRIDEVLLDAMHHVQRNNEGYRVNLGFSQEYDDESLLSVNGNEYLLKVAFSNLMENGCKFSNDHHCRVEVAVNSDHLLVTFTDTGIGIPEEDIPRIFEPFFRGSNRKEREGYGIGLALTRKIINLHGGSITVISTEGEGAQFTVRLGG